LKLKTYRGLLLGQPFWASIQDLMPSIVQAGSKASVQLLMVQFDRR